MVAVVGFDDGFVVGVVERVGCPAFDASLSVLAVLGPTMPSAVSPATTWKRLIVARVRGPSWPPKGPAWQFSVFSWFCSVLIAAAPALGGRRWSGGRGRGVARRFGARGARRRTPLRAAAGPARRRPPRLATVPFERTSPSHPPRGARADLDRRPPTTLLESVPPTPGSGGTKKLGEVLKFERRSAEVDPKVGGADTTLQRTAVTSSVGASGQVG